MDENVDVKAIIVNRELGRIEERRNSLECLSHVCPTGRRRKQLMRAILEAEEQWESFGNQ